MKRLFIYMVVCCMALSAVLLASCERETWYVPEWSIEPGEPIEVLLPIEVPKADSVAVTRGMSEVEEHNIKNLYVLVFTASDGKLYSQQYYDSDRLNEAKTNYSITKDWGSVIDDSKPTNSTNGTIMAKALSETCFIYGIANVTSASSGVDGESTADLETILNNLVTKSEHEADPSKTVTTIDDLYNLVAELKYGTADLMNRDNSNLLMSGVFEMKDGYQTKVGGVDQYTPYQSKYVKGIAGLVDFNYIINTFKDTGDKIVDVKGEGAAAKYYVDLSNAGVIKLRRVASHVIFKISIDDNVFSDFKPESWQVLHVPTKSYLMDQGDETHVVENTFKNGDEVKSMIHAEGTYQFDFYMYENFKNARDITGQTGNFTYYQTNYGNTLEATTNGDDPLPGIKAPNGIYYRNAALEVWEVKKKTKPSLTLDQAKTNYADEINQLAKQNFTYAKRELALKNENGTFDRNVDNTKKYVYVEPNATTVVFKGRLRFNATNFKLKNLLTGEETSPDNVADSYADVTYTVHLGYARTNNIQGTLPVIPDGATAEQIAEIQNIYKLRDFNTLRNTRYTYNVHINGINSIYTQVETETDDDMDKREVAQLQSGASGFIGKASGKVYDVDAHYNSFIIFLSKTHLSTGANGLRFEIKTPWSSFSLDDCLKTDPTDPTKKILDDEAYNNWLKNNPDFNWIKLRRNYDQTKGAAEDYINNIGTAHRTTMPYYVDNTKVASANQDAHQTDCPLIDLYQLLKELELFATTGVPAKVGDTVYSGDNLLKLSNLGDGDGLFYTVFLDEYYYQAPPLRKNGSSPGTPIWSTDSGHEPYWHKFVNQPARYVSFGTSNSSYTHDGESSKIEPELMIVQHSIQSHYATAANVQVGLGMEHYNETPHPRWKDTGRGKVVDQSGNRKNGWVNAKNAIIEKDGVDQEVSWFNYVANYVGLYNNITMQPVDGTLPTIERGQDSKDSEIDAQYKANAIRLCMNRNRDENGDGKIDEGELKWYLPASEQLDIINMCHFSFSDPLLNYNDYIESVDGNGNITYRLRNWKGEKPKEFIGKHFYQFHFVTSDYMKLIGEEMMNLNTYKQTGDWATRPGEMRCVRNLGTGKDKDGNTLDKPAVKKPYFSYSGSTASGGLSVETEYQDHPGSVPGEIFKFEPKLVNGKWTKKYFIMDSHLDKRSIRTAKYVNEEVPPNYLFSEDNRPYKAFQVAQDYIYLRMSVYGKSIGGTKYMDLKDIYEMRPCSGYTEEANDADLGSWRTPTAAELSLMIHYLRVTSTGENEGKAVDNYTPSLFFGTSTAVQPFSTTSENWTGGYWIRMVVIRQDNDYFRKLTLTDPQKITYDANGVPTSATVNKNYGEANGGLKTGISGFYIRCVKDIEPPIEN